MMLAALPWWAWIGPLVVAWVVLAAQYVPPLLIRRWQFAMMRRRFRGKLALTYDDGPDTELTPALIDLLADHDAGATFYLVGFRVDRHPEVCDRLLEAGHELGCHTYWHVNLWKQWPGKGVADIEQAYRAMSRWIPSDAPFRPPWGKLTTWAHLTLVRRARRPVWWTYAVGDTFSPLPDVESVCRRVIRDRGGVLLIHSFHENPEARAFVLTLTRRLLETAREHGLEVCTMREGWSGSRASGGSGS